jgi:hypothetical protein
LHIGRMNGAAAEKHDCAYQQINENVLHLRGCFADNDPTRLRMVTESRRPVMAPRLVTEEEIGKP